MARLSRDLCLADVVRLLSADDVAKVASCIKCAPTPQDVVNTCQRDAASRTVLVNFLFSGCKTPPRDHSPPPRPQCPPPPMVRRGLPRTWRIESPTAVTKPVTPLMH